MLFELICFASKQQIHKITELCFTVPEEWNVDIEATTQKEILKQ